MNNSLAEMFFYRSNFIPYRGNCSYSAIHRGQAPRRERVPQQ